jgi:hypothetical protein
MKEIEKCTKCKEFRAVECGACGRALSASKIEA